MVSFDWVNDSAPYVLPRLGSQQDAWTEEAASHGHTGSQRLLEVVEVVPPAEIAEALGLAAGDRAVVRRRLVLLDDRPVEIADSYFPASIARGTPLAEPKKIRGGSSSALDQLGHRPHRIREDITARMPTNEERNALALGTDEPVFVLRRRVESTAAVPIEVSVMTTPAIGRRYTYETTVS